MTLFSKVALCIESGDESPEMIWHLLTVSSHLWRMSITCAHLNMCHFCMSIHTYITSACCRLSQYCTPKFLTSWTGWGDCDLLSSRRSRVDRTFRLHLTPVYLTSCTTQLLANSSNQFTHMRDNEPLPCHSLLHVFDAVSVASGVRTYVGWLVCNALYAECGFRWC